MRAQGPANLVLRQAQDEVFYCIGDEVVLILSLSKDEDAASTRIDALDILRGASAEQEGGARRGTPTLAAQPAE